MMLSRYKSFISLIAVITIITSLLVIIGWLTGNEHLKSVIPGLPTMKFNTAICFMLAGCSLYLINTGKKINYNLQKITSAALLIIALLTFIEIYFNLDIKIDEWFVKDTAERLGNKSHPGRMAPSTAWCMLLTGFSFIFSASEKKNMLVAGQFALHLVTLISFIAILGYLYKIPQFYTLSFLSSMAINTAVLLFILSIAASFINHWFGFTGLFTGNKMGSIMARRLFPVISFVVIILGSIRLQLHWKNMVSVDFGIALYATSFIIVSLILIGYTARYLNKIDEKKKFAEESLQKFNKKLEQIVEERTKELEQTSKRLSLATKGGNIGIWDWDVEKNILTWDKKMYELYGISEADFSGAYEAWVSGLHPDDREAGNRAIENSIIGKKEFNIEFRVIWPDTSVHYIKGNALIQRNEAGKAIRMIGTNTDITEQKQKDEIILNNERKFRLALGIMGDNIWEHDFITDKTFFAETIHEFIGYTNQEISDEAAIWWRLVHPDDHWMLKQTDADYRAGLISRHHLEYRIYNKDGKLKWVLDRGVVVEKDNAGKPLKIVGTHTDITARKTAETSLDKIKKQFQSFMEHIPAMAWIVDKQSVYQFTNDNYLTTFYNNLENGEQEQLVGKSFFELFPPEIAELYKSNNDIVFNSNQVLETIEPSVDKAGKKITLKVFKFPLQISNAETLLGGIAIDITELVKAEENMRLLNEKITASNKELEQFAYVASHDLQEPLRMVSSFMQLLEKKYSPELDDTAKQYIHFAVDGADRMKKLILDLLSFSRIGTELQFNDNVDLNEILREVKLNLMSAISENGATISVEKLPLIKANKIQISQLFQNLVNNAIKYRSEKNPEIKIGCTEEPGYYRFYVKDNGIGIDSKYFEKIFVIFQRLHNRTQFSGTGIGLSICKKIAEKHKGYIKVESIVGQGSTFSFYFPKK